jgi:hypothetical protein
MNVMDKSRAVVAIAMVAIGTAISGGKFASHRRACDGYNNTAERKFCHCATSHCFVHYFRTEKYWSIFRRKWKHFSTRMNR